MEGVFLIVSVACLLCACALLIWSLRILKRANELTEKAANPLYEVVPINMFWNERLIGAHDLLAR